jgi:cytochrome b561
MKHNVLNDNIDCCGSSFLWYDHLFRYIIFFVINSLGIIFQYIVKLLFDINIFYFFLVMYFSTWNVNLFKVSNSFHVYK